MIIKSLILENIRSYKTQEFKFREGITLLSGDIGSGKSTVLLAIEFALFGLIRGSINGAALLRHGTKEGTVKLVFKINNEEYEIIRGLKKTNAGIVQDKCSFRLNDETTNLTPIEMKSKVLNALGYPEELVTKSKTLIFRYTVYTPQEEMKKILFETKEDRLEKLRRIFGIDKYELVKNNAANYARELRVETRQLTTLQEELQKIKTNMKTNLTELNLLYEYHETLKKEHEPLTKKLQELGLKHNLVEDKVKEMHNLKTKKNVIKTELHNFQRQEKELNNNLTQLKEEINIREKKLEPIKLIEGQEEKNKEELNKLLIKKEEILTKHSELKEKDAITKNKIKEIQQMLKEVHELENCPTCKQEVTEKHKDELKLREDEKLKELKEREKKLKEILEKIQIIKDKLNEKEKKLRDEQDQIRNNKYKKKIYDTNKKIIDEKKDEIQKILKKEQKLKIEIEQKKEIETNIEDKLKQYTKIEEEIKKIKEDKDKQTKKQHEIEKEISAKEQAIKDKTKYIEEKKEQENTLNKKIKQINEKKTTENWLTNHFINLTDIIEKHTLTKIHREFNELFKEWFNMLIDDQNIDANIDKDFSITINQNGYDTDTDNLSGGEKTAIALAYRLALNKVINNLIHNIKTKQFLILDEPTDGFSTEQLDRVRDVLERAQTKQTIIVSHEAKLESFAENIIRINKNNHEGEIIQI